MPFVNGVGFLYRLRAQTAHRHTPVAIITGDSCIDDPAMTELHGLDAEVCFKPMWIDEVVTLTRTLLAKRRADRPAALLIRLNHSFHNGARFVTHGP